VGKQTIIGLTATFLLGCLFVTNYWWNKTPQQLVPVEMTVEQKKQRFVQLLVPVVTKVHDELGQQYQQVHDLVQSGDGGSKLNQLKQEYRVETDDELLAILKPHPISITLAQAAMESSWATSRFFVNGNNVFGVWSFDEDEERMAARKKRGSKTVWLKKYPTLKASVKDYYRTLARGVAFRKFRKTKMVSDDPYLLVKKLDRYSEKGALYGQELAEIIRYNDFELYDE
jgi:Bax protein